VPVLTASPVRVVVIRVVPETAADNSVETDPAAEERDPAAEERDPAAEERDPAADERDPRAEETVQIFFSLPARRRGRRALVTEKTP